MIALYITLWLLSGFLAAWVGHCLEQKHFGPRDTSILAVMMQSLLGLLSVLLLCLYCIFEVKVLSKPFFKAKEKK